MFEKKIQPVNENQKKYIKLNPFYALMTSVLKTEFFERAQFGKEEEGKIQ